MYVRYDIMCDDSREFIDSFIHDFEHDEINYTYYFKKVGMTKSKS